MPRKQKGANNPLFTKRSILKRGRSKGRGVAQKDLVADTGEANPTEALQTKPAETPQRVVPKANPIVTDYVPTMGNSVLNVPPEIPPTPFPYPSSSQSINFASDDYAPPPIYFNENVPAPTPPIEKTKTEDTYSFFNPIDSKFSFDSNSGSPESQFSYGQQTKDKGFSYGSTPPAVQSVSEATSRFFNTLNEFFGVLGNPNK